VAVVAGVLLDHVNQELTQGDRNHPRSAMCRTRPSSNIVDGSTARRASCGLVTAPYSPCRPRHGNRVRSPIQGNGDGQNSFTVDVSQAAVTVDGATGPTLAPGQFVAVLGEGDHDTLLAASVYAFSAAPTVTGGEVSAVDGTVVTFGEDDTSTSLDLGTATLVINGNPGGTVDQITPGNRLVVIGSTDGTGTFTATMAFAFNSGDRGPVGENDD
jgi:hypothetical protein